MNFQPYDKIYENFAHLQVEPKEMKKLDKVLWVVTEKIHGANFSVHFSNNEVSYAKRKEILQLSDDFFAFQLIVERLEANFQRLHQLLVNQYPNLNSCVIYGELFGGEYPHPEVKADSRLQAIQTGVYYSPTIEFCIFDIKISTNQTTDFISYETLIELCENANLLYAKPLLVGKLHLAMNFDTRIDSQIPALLGYPALPQKNLIEGIVIKPFQHLNISTSRGVTRPVLKIKNPEFSEIEEYHLAQKWSFVPSKDEITELIWSELQHFVTQNRWNSVISKTGIPQKSDFIKIRQIQEMFVEDVIDSFTDFYKNFWNELNKEQIIELKKKIMRKASLFI
ncbi:MAG: hypothetical protein OHK0038_11760 [Flammeovirgaceae bacterium]